VTKALIAGAVWLLFADGSLTPQTRAAGVIDEFGTNGKGVITVEQLLLHTAGIPRAPMRPEEGATSEGRLKRFAQWRLTFEPGTACEYHATSAHWVLAELIERAAGLDYRAFVRARVLDPLGLDRFTLGTGVEGALDLVAKPSEQEVPIELQPQILERYNEPTVRSAGVPGAGGIARAADVVLFFQALLRNPGDLWDPAVLADGTGVVRNRFIEPIRGVPANRTRGLVVAGDDGNAAMRGFARDAGPRTFASHGVGGQIAWADPDSGVSFCYLTNGIDDLVRAHLRSVAISERARAAIESR
jgi:CubicO group peptidase (beta-lactamase class C family)